jgi:hypothetical protein
MSLKNLSQTHSAETADTIIINEVKDLADKSVRGVYYVSQDNYVFVNYDGFTDVKLYADSATSCIIVIINGKNENGKNLLGIAHLSRTTRFQNFFAMAEQVFRGDVLVYASGANPAEPIMTTKGYDYTALRNTDNLREWVSAHAYNPDTGNTPPNPRIIGNMIHVGVGNPSVYNLNLDCFGANLLDGSASRDRQWLADAERDATGGVQTLFCIYGPENIVRPQFSSFTDAEKTELVQKAKSAGFDKAADMTDEQILDEYSSTPRFEVPWFCDTIRAAAVYVKSHS